MAAEASAGAYEARDEALYCSNASNLAAKQDML
jgi:hypothetical protein